MCPEEVRASDKSLTALYHSDGVLFNNINKQSITGPSWCKIYWTYHILGRNNNNKNIKK